ncbi:MAG: hypothetical protein HKN89_11420 [Eudoraea sp.]|nr:hypothetical protein [Eudoraea sp.]
MTEPANEFKVFCIGANLESYESLKYLIDHECRIHTLITLPSGHNKHVSDYFDLHEFCREQGINVLDSTNVNSKETLTALRKEKPDYLFTLGWSQIFREDFIECFSKLIVGTHPTKLPYGRGRAPLPWTILEDLRESAVSFFKIDKGVDTGKLIFQRNFDIPKGAYVGELYERVAKELAQGFMTIYEAIYNGDSLTFTPQANEGVTVRGKRVPSDGLIEFDRSASEIDRLIRAVSKPYPGAYCYYKDQKIIFWEVEEDGTNIYSGALGQILKRNKKGVLVQFQDKTLWLLNPTLDNDQSLDLKFFKLGDKLGYNMQDELFKLKQGL